MDHTIEYIVGPIYFIFLIVVAYYLKDFVGNKEYQRFFLWGFFLRLVSCVFFYLIYFNIYNGGDTISYFRRAVYITDILFKDFFVGVKLLFNNPHIYDNDTAWHFSALTATDQPTYLVAKLGALTNIICFNSYIANAYLFSLVCYFGLWKLFVLLCDIFPNRKKQLAIGFLYVPSTIFWSSGIMKDTITLTFLCLTIYSTYYVFILKRNIIINIISILIGIYIVGVIKSYILLVLLPSLIFWIFLLYRSSIKSKIYKQISTPILLILIVVGGYFSISGLGSLFSKFSIENIESKAKSMQQWHTMVVEVYQEGKGSSYNLGELDYSTTGLLKKFPLAVNVALFRPWPFEVGSPIILFESIQSTILLILTLYFFLYLIRHFRPILILFLSNPTILFLLFFSIVFAFSVGFTSYNFGALSRYRIPLLPFYTSAILILIKDVNEYRQYLQQKKLE